MGGLDQNSGLHTCATSTLWVEPLPSSQLILYLFKDVTCHPSVLQHVCFRYLFPTISRSKMGDLEKAVAWEEPG